MENLNTLELDVFGFGLGTETQEPAIEEGTESPVNMNEQMDQILALCDANESLDAQYAVGLVNGLESISDSYRLILMTQATTMMDAGIESDDIAVLLNAAGIDCSVYEAGLEAKEGGLVQPLRSAGNWAKGTKAYKAVADSWAGKSGAYIVNKINQFLAWLSECIFGKASKEVDKTMTAVVALSNNKSEHEEKYNKLKAEYDKIAEELKAAKGRANKLAADNDNLSKDKANQKKASDEEIAKIKKVLEAEVAAEKKTTAAVKKLLEAAQSTIDDKNAALDNMHNNMQAEIDAMYDEKTAAKQKHDREIAQKNAKISELQGTIDSKDQSLHNLQGAYLEQVEAASEAYAEVRALKEAAAVATQSAQAIVNQANSPQLSELNKIVVDAAKSKKEYISFVKKLKKVLFNSKRGKKNRQSVHGRPTRNTSPGLASEEFDITSIFMIDGTESVNEMFGIKNDEYEIDMDEAMESPELDIVLAKFDMMAAISAGNESMNMDHFGHPYIAVDFNSQRIYGITPGMEAEDLADTKDKADKEAKDGEKKEDKKEGGFKESLSKAGSWIKGRPHYIAVQFRRFVKWLMSKSSILDAMLTKLALVFSRNVDVKSILTDEKKKALIDVVVEFTYGIKKASYDIDKITVENFNGEEPKEDAIRKSVEEKLSKLEKVNSSHTASGLDKLGLAEASKELRALKKKLSEKNLEKLVKAEKLTADKQKEFSATMAQINRSSTRLTIITRKLVTSAKKAAAAEKDSKKEEKKETAETK